MAIDRGSRRSYARAGRAGDDGPSPEGSKPRIPERRRTVSRETIPDAPSAQVVSGVCSIARGLGYTIRKLLDVWESSLDGDTPFYEEIRDDLSGAARLLTSMTYDYQDKP